MGKTSFFSRFKLWQTFLILSLVGLVVAAIPTVLYVREAGKALSAYTGEQEGITATRATLQVLQLTQQHRGLSALVLGGTDSAAGPRAEKEREVQAAYAAVGALVARLNDKELANKWATASSAWEILRADVAGKRIGVPESFAAHSALCLQLLKINELAGDHFGLSLDPDKDTYQLIQAMHYQLPVLTEELGKLRAKGGGLLAKKEATAEDRLALSAIAARVNDRLDQTANAFGKSVAYNAANGTALGGAMNEASRAALGAIALAQEQIVKPEALSYPGADYVATVTQAIDAQFTLNRQASALLEKVLDEKVSAFHRTRWAMLAAMLGLLGVAALLVRQITQSVTLPMNNAVAVAQSVAKGNLVNDFHIASDNEVGQMLAALKEMNDSLRGIVGGVRGSVDTINAAARDIAQGNADVSARLESQASNLEETASSMEELTSTVKQNAENARQANMLVSSASEVASRGGKVVADVVHTMEEINQSSRKIVDIISVIDGIAFQTNILALNAAVEAARAGEQGRGFAVVASEVRNLAQRSASAAKEIKALINLSVERVEQGNQLASSAGAAMEEIVGSVMRITTIMSEIATASAEQGAGIEQVNTAVTQMDDMTQQNAAMVEETAAASSSLQEQAQALVQAMSIFTIGQEETAQPAPRRRLPGRALALRN